MEKQFDVICMGRVAVDLYSQQIGARLEDASSFAKYLGGSSGNVAYGTARQGLRSSMLARVGDEHMGRFLREELNQVGCDTSHLITDKDRLTALVLLGIKDRDTFPLIFYRDNCADMAITASDVDESYIASARCLAITGTHLSHPQTREAVLTALGYARRHGVRTVLDIDYRPVLWGLTALGDGETRFIAADKVTRELQEVLHLFDVIVGTEEEFHIAGGSTDTLQALGQVRAVSEATLVAGRASISTPSAQFNDIGERMSPFERIKPWAVYVTPQETVQVKALTKLELAVCAAPGKGTYPTRLIAPQDIEGEARGKGHNQRYVHNILPEDKPADSLLVVEVWTSEGCTSSYPSHKHDTDNPPQETYLEETYYHRLNPEQGFCMQRVYTDDRTLDECMAVYNRDVVMVPKGYHPVATMAGYDSYYLNVMAGPVRKWMFTWEEDHAWINRDYPAERGG